MKPIRIRRIEPHSRSRLGALDSELYRLCLEVRRKVFTVGQGVPEEREFDGLDAEAEHFLAFRDVGRAASDPGPPEPKSEPVEALGTARLRRVGHAAKAERVAVDEAARGEGIGRDLMRALETRAQEIGCRQVILSAQVPVIEFYERLGYVAEGPIYEDVGIPHRDMRKTLDAKASPGPAANQRFENR